MKKQILTIALLILTSVAFAQSTSSRNQPQLNVGVGLSSWGVPVYLGLDFWVHPDITLGCLLYTSPSPRDRTRSRMPSSA